MKEERKEHSIYDDKIDEEYSAEFTPKFSDYSFDKNVYTNRSTTTKIIGYIGLFFSLFSIVFLPILFGTIGVIIGIFTVIRNQRTLGYTTIGFGAFAILFALFAYS